MFFSFFDSYSEVVSIYNNILRKIAYRTKHGIITNDEITMANVSSSLIIAYRTKHGIITNDEITMANVSSSLIIMIRILFM